MGLFGSKKKEDKLPPLEFPELPKSIPKFEGQDQQPSQMPVGAAEIKQAVSQPLDVPQMPDTRVSGPEQPLFVKIEKYKDVVENLNKLKKRLGDADNILSKLHRLKEEEDRELQAWHNDLQKIRNQLMNVDKNLFE
tara:strand:- start:1800 stop:2207 length:408 start_codon:yes stop_codon:yes gene_type:complete